MKKIIMWLVVNSLIIILVACGDMSVRPELGGEFRLKLSQEAIIESENLKLKFKSVDEDSRCPIRVQCHWAGNGKITIGVADTNLVLNTYLEPKVATYSKYLIKLIALDPYPVDPRQVIKPKDYTAILVVSKI